MHYPYEWVPYIVEIQVRGRGPLRLLHHWPQLAAASAAALLWCSLEEACTPAVQEQVERQA